MATISFTIPEDKISRVIAAMKGLYPIPTNEAGEPLFTDAQWSKQAVKEWIITQVARYEQLVAQKAIPFTRDTSIISDE